MDGMTLDREFESLVYSPVCFWCVHLRDRDPERRRCAAFPEAGTIPLDVWNGDNLHTKPIEGDHGIQFVKTEKGD